MDAQRVIRRRPRNKGVKCVDCANAIFDERWGEYKCKVRQIKISNPSVYTGCKHHVKDTKKT